MTASSYNSEIMAVFNHTWGFHDLSFPWQHVVRSGMVVYGALDHSLLSHSTFSYKSVINS